MKIFKFPYKNIIRFTYNEHQIKVDLISMKIVSHYIHKNARKHQCKHQCNDSNSKCIYCGMKIIKHVDDYGCIFEDGTFYFCEPDITSINRYAFKQCNELKLIEIPSSVTKISNHAFNKCTSLKSITIPASVTEIGDTAFYYCNSLTSIIVDENNLQFSSSDDGMLFDENKTILIRYPLGKSDINYSIPTSVVKINASAFSGCSSLTSITIQTSVTEIGDSAFSGCSSLTSIEIPTSINVINASAFSGCSSLTSIEIPTSVAKINGSAFNKCTSLKSIIIPSSVKVINGDAFSDCSSLTSIIVDKNNLQFSSSDDGMLFDENKTILIRYPLGKFNTNYTIPTSVTEINGSAFSGCNSLTSIEIKTSVVKINNNVFKNCTSLSSITIPTSVTEIGINAFSGCTALESIILKPSNHSNELYNKLKDQYSGLGINIIIDKQPEIN